MIKQWIQQRLASGHHPRLQRLVEELRALGHGHDLDRLGRVYGTDKVGHTPTRPTITTTSRGSSTAGCGCWR